MTEEVKTEMASAECRPSLVKSAVSPSAPRLIPLVDWPKYHPWPPLGGLRHMVFYGEKTGFSKVIVKCGRRLLIDEKKFFEFVEEQNLNREGASQ